MGFRLFGRRGRACTACGTVPKDEADVVCQSCGRTIPFAPEKERIFLKFADDLMQPLREVMRWEAKHGAKPWIGLLNDAELIAIRQIFGVVANALESGRRIRLRLTLQSGARKGVIAVVASTLIGALDQTKMLEVVYAAHSPGLKATASETVIKYVGGLVSVFGHGHPYVPEGFRFVLWEDLGAAKRSRNLHDRIFIIGDVDHPGSTSASAFDVCTADSRQNFLLLHDAELS